MTQRAKTWKTFVCFAIFTAGVRFTSSTAPGAEAATPSAAAAAKALDLFNSGNLSGAEDAYNTFLSQYPTAGEAPEALFRLGYIQYLQGEYNPALMTLGKLKAPPATLAIKSAGDSLIPQIMSAEAAQLNPGDPGRIQAFSTAAKAFDDFIKKYPTSQEVESAIYGKAVAAYQSKNYEEAVKSLLQNLQQFPNSDTTLDNKDLLAVVLTAEGTTLLRQKQPAAAAAKFNEAISYLAQIIEANADVQLSNNAQYQIGELLFDRANSEKGATQATDLKNSMAAFRAVQSNDFLIQAQQGRVNYMLTRVRQAAQGNDAGTMEKIQHIQDRENSKLQSLKKADDQSLSAQLRIAACYFLMQKYDEARVMMQYLQAFTTDPQQKKQILYYMTLSYASQGVMDKAETSYNAFQSAYPRDPLGENLPVVMGAAYLTGSNPQPDKASSYFQKERALYPDSPLVNDALNEQAAALVGMKKYGEAITSYQQFLATKPPPVQAGAAMQGIAAIYQQTGRMADAVKQYQSVADTFPGTALAEQNAFYAAGLETSVNAKQALPMLQAFVQKYPKGQYTPRAFMMIAQVQSATGDQAGALQTYKDVVSKYPTSEMAPQAYFQQVAILEQQNKSDDVVALMQAFINAYPDNKNVFYAYDTIGQTQVTNGKVSDAIATYADMADKHGDNPKAPTALYRTADLWRKMADSLGRYQALSDDQRKAWSTDIHGSITAGENLLNKYPESAPVGLTLKTLLSDQEALLAAGQQTEDGIQNYFHDLAAKFASDPAAHSRIIFTLATYTYQKNPVMGMAQMNVSYNPSLVYAPGDLDLYGRALLGDGKPEKAYQVYTKIAADYPIPAGARPAQAPPATQEAQAMALFGMASALDKEGKSSEAGNYFAQLKANYPWSPKVVEANFGIAKALVKANKMDQAQKLLVSIVGSMTAPTDLRAHAFLLIGQIQEGNGNIPAAIDSYLKTATFYSGVPDAAAEGLWRGGQMLEAQAVPLTEASTPKKSEQIAKAVSSYKDLVTKYPDSPFVQQAQDRLKALGSM